MTTYYTMTATVTEALESAGMSVTDGSRTRAVFQSRLQEPVSAAQGLLRELGFTLNHVAIGRDGYAFTFVYDAPSGGSPETVLVRYDHVGTYRPLLALCYIEDGGVYQFRMPFRSAVPDAGSSEGRQLLADFEQFFPGVQPVWIPFLRGTPLVRY